MKTIIIESYLDIRDNLTAFVFESNYKEGGYGVSLRDNDSGLFAPVTIHGLTLEAAREKAKGITGNAINNYSVRREVLNMPLKMWDKFPAGDFYHGTTRNFFDTIGLPGGKTAFFNDEERKFFDELYAIQTEEELK